MKRWLVLVAVVALLPGRVWAQATPTATAGAATPAATASPDGAQRVDTQSKRLGGDRVERAETFEAGLQIGTTAAGASLLTFVKRGSCTFDVASLTTATVAPTPWPGYVPKVSKITCTATGAATGDLVFTTGLDVFDTATTTYEALSVSRCKVTATNTLSCWLHYSGSAALDPAPLTLNYLVVR